MVKAGVLAISAGVSYTYTMALTVVGASCNEAVCQQEQAVLNWVGHQQRNCQSVTRFGQLEAEPIVFQLHGCACRYWESRAASPPERPAILPEVHLQRWNNGGQWLQGKSGVLCSSVTPLQQHADDTCRQ